MSNTPNSSTDSVSAVDEQLTRAGLPTYSEMIASLSRLVPHVLHYASMPQASSDAHRDAANARAVIKGATSAQADSKEIADQKQFPEGEGLVFSVPVTVDTTMSGRALVRAINRDAAIQAARHLAADGKVAMSVDDGNYRGLADYYCPDEGDVEVAGGSYPSIVEETLERCGYDITEDSDQPGMWVWMAPSDACEVSFQSKDEAIAAAWTDAVEQAKSILDIPVDLWRDFDLNEAAEKVHHALAEDDPYTPSPKG